MFSAFENEGTCTVNWNTTRCRCGISDFLSGLHSKGFKTIIFCRHYNSPFLKKDVIVMID